MTTLLPFAGLSSSRTTVGRRGSALIGVVLSLSLLMVGSSYFLEYFARQTSQMAAMQMASRQETMELILKRNVRSGLAMYASVLGPNKAINPGLYGCLFNEVGDVPNDCDTATTYPVTMFDYGGGQMTGPSPASPFCYNELGAPTWGAPPCVFAVWTEFTPVCNGAATCNVASGLKMKITMDVTPINGGILKRRVFDSYVPLSDTAVIGQWSLVTYDFQDPAYRSIVYYYEGPMVPWGGACVDVTSLGCGAGYTGLSTLPGGVMPPPGSPPASTMASCAAGFVARGGGCSPFSM